MNIELRNVTYNARLSEETPAYAADIWVDGKKRGTVKNDGHGGPDHVQPHTLGAEIEAYAKTLPPVEGCGTMLSQSTEMVLGALLDDVLVGRELKRKLRTHRLFVQDGAVYQTKGAAPAGVVVLNGLPFDQALTLYRKYVATK